MIAIPIGFFGNSGTFTHGNCCYFDGVNDIHTIPAAAQTNFGSGDFALNFWLNPRFLTAGLASNCNLLIKYVDASNYIEIYKPVNSRRLLMGVVIGGVAHSVFVTGAGTTNNADDLTWYNYNFQRSGGQLMIHLNAQLATSPVNSNLSLAVLNNSPWRIGADVSRRGGRMAFYFDSLSLFNRGLSAAEIKYLYNGLKGNNPLGMSGLVGYYRWDEPAGYGSFPATFSDSSGYNNHGTMAGYSSGSTDFRLHSSL